MKAVAALFFCLRFHGKRGCAEVRLGYLIRPCLPHSANRSAPQPSMTPWRPRLSPGKALCLDGSSVLCAFLNLRLTREGPGLVAFPKFPSGQTRLQGICLTLPGLQVLWFQRQFVRLSLALYGSRIRVGVGDGPTSGHVVMTTTSQSRAVYSGGASLPSRLSWAEATHYCTSSTSML